MLKKLKKGLKNPRLFVLGALFLVARLIPDKLYLSIYYRLNMRKRLDWSDLQTYNEKLQWLKIHNRKPEMTEMVDKYQAKRYVAERIGVEYIIPTLGIYDSVEDIDFDALPNQFVLKCTHDSGGIVICTDKSVLDKDAARKKLRKFLKRGYFWLNREWPYKHVPRRIIAEQYMVDESGYELKDYKFFCFDGEPKALFIATDRGRKDEETKFDFFDMDFNHLPVKNGHPNSPRPIACPPGFEKMKELAAKLSQGQPHVRVDFYDINGKVYFGELTFYHWSGVVPFDPEEWDYTFGSWIKLPR